MLLAKRRKNLIKLSDKKVALSQKFQSETLKSAPSEQCSEKGQAMLFLQKYCTTPIGRKGRISLAKEMHFWQKMFQHRLAIICCLVQFFLHKKKHHHRRKTHRVCFCMYICAR